MDTKTLAIIVLLGSFALMILLRFPIAYGVALSSIFCLLVMGNSLFDVCRLMVKGISTYSLMAVPFFITMGVLMGSGGISAEPDPAPDPEASTPEAPAPEVCQGIQKGSPVDAHVTPEPWDMPGYDSQVIMAAGAFTNGASVELSADAPLREPYAVWIQGGISWRSARISILLAAQEMLTRKLIKI